MTIQTVNQQTAHSAKPLPGGPLGSMALAFLLLPMAGIKPVRNRLRKLLDFGWRWPQSHCHWAVWRP
jgi:hypothetical protein